MFAHMFFFELKYRSRRISTYVYFAIWFFMAFLAVSARDFGPIGSSKVLLNGPFAISVYCVQLTAFGALVISALFGTSILRDFQEDTYQLIFTKPVSKWTYLGGRWLGSIAVALIVFSGLPLGVLLGTWMPSADRERLAAFDLWWYVQPFVSFTAVQIFFLGSLFFMVAALTRRLIVVYLQGVVVFAGYLIVSIFLQNSENTDAFWPAVFDPLGLVLLQRITRYWTVAEKNTMLIDWSGMMLYNRLVCIGAGALSLLFTYLLFPMKAEALVPKISRRRARLQLAEQERERDTIDLQLRPASRWARSPVQQSFGASAALAQLTSLTRIRFLNIVREAPFWAIFIMMIVLAILSGKQAGRFSDTSVWPVTYLMTTVLQVAGLFYYIVATLYSGELIWRERDVRFAQIHDSMPVSSAVNWSSKFLAIAAVQFLLVSIVMVCGMGIQAYLGYFNFELHLYFKELYLIALPNILSFVLLAFFFHTVIPNKYAAHAAVIGLNMLVPILSRYGFENRLYLPGEIAPYTYSDMNGYGHFVPSVFWSILYWSAFSVILGVLSLLFTLRGTDSGWTSRIRDARTRFRGATAVVGVSALLLFIGSGVWYHYNTRIVNEFQTATESRKKQAQYERDFKKYEGTVQPKIVAVDIATDIFPERRSMAAKGHYLLVNRSDKSIPAIHVTGSKRSIQEVRFDRPFQKEFENKRSGFWIYKLERQLAPGETLRMDFRISYESLGFRDGENRNELAYNGTFFDRDYFPSIGYSWFSEIGDPVRRREEKLPPQKDMATAGDPRYANVNLFTPDSDWITFRTIVSTSPDQIAIAPGYLKREWTANGRRYFEYDMGDTRINNFFSFVSGRFAVKRDLWRDVKLEIYHHPGHEYNLEKMMDASKKGLAYLEQNFSPYQFKQFRVIEFPRYRGFAQSFPNTVPFSEMLGFIQKRDEEKDLDAIYYITAHELAHQWWGHQVVGSMTQGSNMMSETLAQYSALMILEKTYGPHHIRKFLRSELDSYLRGRGRELRREPPLSQVQREPYVWYNKGSLAMYALKDYIGEERLNSALKKLIAEKGFTASSTLPSTLDLIRYLREATPPEMQYLITDMFESIVLFDNKAVTATWSEMPDRKYKVIITVESRKLKADGSGVETEMAMNDSIDIGVFTGDKKNEKPLYMAKHKVSGKKTLVEVIVSERPARAGIDPYNKLIDRKPDDNVVNATKLEEQAC